MKLVNVMDKLYASNSQQLLQVAELQMSFVRKSHTKSVKIDEYDTPMITFVRRV